MTTIKEDYVSFEVAKLLKEKGFDEYCPKSYFKMDKTLKESGFSEWEKVNEIKAPTQSLAMKWLREVHNLFIQTEITPWPRKGFFVKIYLYKKQHNDFEEVSYVKYEKSYEQACEAGIKYCLENLI